MTSTSTTNFAINMIKEIKSRSKIIFDDDVKKVTEDHSDDDDDDDKKEPKIKVVLMIILCKLMPTKKVNNKSRKSR
ncbi:unnamed protein product [Rhizophagus irregularis]|nr:unnamed protein product [Rhizophagus irregularis]